MVKEKKSPPRGKKDKPSIIKFPENPGKEKVRALRPSKDARKPRVPPHKYKEPVLVITPQIITHLCALIRMGNFPLVAADYVGIDRTRFNRWMTEGAEIKRKRETLLDRLERRRDSGDTHSEQYVKEWEELQALQGTYNDRMVTLNESVLRAAAVAEVRALERINEAAEGGDWKADEWWLTHGPAKKRYTPTREHKHSGKVTKKVEHTHDHQHAHVTLTTEDLKHLTLEQKKVLLALVQRRKQEKDTAPVQGNTLQPGQSHLPDNG